MTRYAALTDRTGHTSSAMLNRYRRVARTGGEPGRACLVPFAVALQELSGE